MASTRGNAVITGDSFAPYQVREVLPGKLFVGPTSRLPGKSCSGRLWCVVSCEDAECGSHATVAESSNGDMAGAPCHALVLACPLPGREPAILADSDSGLGRVTFRPSRHGGKESPLRAGHVSETFAALHAFLFPEASSPKTCAYVHCLSGKNGSCAFAVLYLMRYHHMPLRTALQAVPGSLIAPRLVLDLANIDAEATTRGPRHVDGFDTAQEAPFDARQYLAHWMQLRFPMLSAIHVDLVVIDSSVPSIVAAAKADRVNSPCSTGLGDTSDADENRNALRIDYTLHMLTHRAKRVGATDEHLKVCTERMRCGVDEEFYTCFKYFHMRQLELEAHNGGYTDGEPSSGRNTAPSISAGRFTSPSSHSASPLHTPRAGELEAAGFPHHNVLTPGSSRVSYSTDSLRGLLQQPQQGPFVIHDPFDVREALMSTHASGGGCSSTRGVDREAIRSLVAPSPSPHRAADVDSCRKAVGKFVGDSGSTANATILKSSAAHKPREPALGRSASKTEPSPSVDTLPPALLNATQGYSRCAIPDKLAHSTFDRAMQAIRFGNSRSSGDGGAEATAGPADPLAAVANRAPVLAPGCSALPPTHRRCVRFALPDREVAGGRVLGKRSDVFRVPAAGTASTREPQNGADPSGGTAQGVQRGMSEGSDAESKKRERKVRIAALLARRAAKVTDGTDGPTEPGDRIEATARAANLEEEVRELVRAAKAAPSGRDSAATLDRAKRAVPVAQRAQSPWHVQDGVGISVKPDASASAAREQQQSRPTAEPPLSSSVPSLHLDPGTLEWALFAGRSGEAVSPQLPSPIGPPLGQLEVAPAGGEQLHTVAAAAAGSTLLSPGTSHALEASLSLSDSFGKSLSMTHGNTVNRYQLARASFRNLSSSAAGVGIFLEMGDKGKDATCRPPLAGEAKDLRAARLAMHEDVPVSPLSASSQSSHVKCTPLGPSPPSYSISPKVVSQQEGARCQGRMPPSAESVPEVHAAMGRSSPHRSSLSTQSSSRGEAAHHPPASLGPAADFYHVKSKAEKMVLAAETAHTAQGVGAQRAVPASDKTCIEELLVELSSPYLTYEDVAACFYRNGKRKRQAIMQLLSLHRERQLASATRSAPQRTTEAGSKPAQHRQPEKSETFSATAAPVKSILKKSIIVPAPAVASGKSTALPSTGSALGTSAPSRTCVDPTGAEKARKPLSDGKATTSKAVPKPLGKSTLVKPRDPKATRPRATVPKSVPRSRDATAAAPKK